MAHEFRLPDIGEGLVDAEIVKWHVAVGDVVAEGDVLVEVETAKAVVELPSPFPGTVLALAAAEGETVEVGAVLITVGEPGESPSEPSQPETAPATSASDSVPVDQPDGTGGPKAMPIIRKLARERGIDLATVVGTGAGGKITREDLDRASRVGAEPTSTPAAAGIDDERVPMTRLRRTIAEHMSRSWAEIPHVTIFDRFDAQRLLDSRRALSSRLGMSLPLEALVIKAVVPVLKEFPAFNAAVDGGDLILRRRYHVAVAVDTPDGLIVPVVHDADVLGVRDLGDRIGRLADDARARTLTPTSLAGGTFTLSNIGAIGGGAGTPIIPAGTTAILSMGRAEDTPVVRHGAVAISSTANVSLSYDHRVIDGGLGQRFMARLIENLQEPTLFLA